MQRALPLLMMLLIGLQSLVSAAEWPVSAAHHNTPSSSQPTDTRLVPHDHDVPVDHAHGDVDTGDHHGLFDCHHANQCHNSLLAVLPMALPDQHGGRLCADSEHRSLYSSAITTLLYRPPIV